MVPLQLVGKVPGKDIPIILWDNKVGAKSNTMGVPSTLFQATKKELQTVIYDIQYDLILYKK